ncbi:MAG: formimidoylglutamase [Bacteroidia bacterium]
MPVKEYFDYLEAPSIDSSVEYEKDSIGARVEHFSGLRYNLELEGANLALIGVKENRGSVTNLNCDNSADAIRKELFQLKNHGNLGHIADLGNLINGATVEDTYSAIALLCAELMRNKIMPIIIGGSQDVTFGQYSAYKQLAQIINIANVDARFDLGKPEHGLDSESYIGKIILEQPNYLFNYSHIAHQTYFVGESAIDQMSKLFFDTYRLGHVRTDMLDIEPVLRNSDLLTFDMSSIKQSDAAATAKPSPNGLYGEEACQLMFYAGMSEKLTSVGIYEYDASKDKDNQTAQLIAQMIWYFMEGFYKRKNEMPQYNRNGYMKYMVTLSNTEHEVIFLKSIKSDRWWMEIPITDNYTKFQRHHIVPCSYKDYQQACTNEMPDRWWQTYQKLC